jgi:hypothetical protein
VQLDDGPLQQTSAVLIATTQVPPCPPSQPPETLFHVSNVIWAAVIAAGISLCSVWLSNRHSGKQLERQLAADALQRKIQREMALRRTADRVDEAARDYAVAHGTARPGLARDRFLIAVAPDDQAEQLGRFGKRFADAMDAEWLVVSVETPALLSLGERARNRRIDVLRLAESLGGQTVTLDGPTVAGTLIAYARLRAISRIVVGEPTRRGWRALVRRSTATELARGGAQSNQASACNQNGCLVICANILVRHHVASFEPGRRRASSGPATRRNLSSCAQYAIGDAPAPHRRTQFAYREY